MPVFLYFFWRGVEKNESGSVLSGQAGIEVTGWLKVVGLVQKDVRRKAVSRLTRMPGVIVLPAGAV